MTLKHLENLKTLNNVSHCSKHINVLIIYNQQCMATQLTTKAYLSDTMKTMVKIVKLTVTLPLV